MADSSQRRRPMNEWRGHCYEAAFEMAERLEGLGFEPAIVHGLVSGRGQLAGKRFGHGWAEANGQAFDLTIGPDFAIPVTLFYSYGEIDADKVRRYTLAEAAKWFDRVEHWGPWERLE